MRQIASSAASEARGWFRLRNSARQLRWQPSRRMAPASIAKLKRAVCREGWPELWFQVLQRRRDEVGVPAMCGCASLEARASSAANARTQREGSTCSRRRPGGLFGEQRPRGVGPDVKLGMRVEARRADTPAMATDSARMGRAGHFLAVNCVHRGAGLRTPNLTLDSNAAGHAFRGTSVRCRSSRESSV